MATSTGTAWAGIGSKDASFGTAFIDVDEWRDAPVRHRYVHGGFEDGDTRFSFYFPPAEQYEGRFFHPVLPMSGIEFAATIGVLYSGAGSIEFAVDSGAYLVESNLGRLNPFPGDGPDDDRVPRLGRRGPLLAHRRRRDVRRAPPVRLRVRRQRWCVQDDQLLREHDRRVGRRSAVRRPDPDEHAVRVLRAGARDAAAVGQVPRHHRRHRAGRQRRHVRRAERRATSGARRGDEDGLPAAVVVRRRARRPRLHRRVVGARRQRGAQRPRILRRLLDRARLSRLRRTGVARRGPHPAQDDDHGGAVRGAGCGARPADADGDAARHDVERDPRRAPCRGSAGGLRARLDGARHDRARGGPEDVRRRRRGRHRHHRCG